MTVWSDDRGRVGERVATIRPAELHRAIAEAAARAIRAGVQAELLDGRRAARLGQLLGAGPDRRATRLDYLDERIAEAERRATNARRNANSADDPDLADELLADAKDARDEVVRLRDERAQLAARHEGLPDVFESDADYVARALANLANIEHTADGEVGEALSHILRIEGMAVTDDGSHVDVSFRIDVPADNRVARLGPVTCRVANRAYRNTLGSTLGSHPLVTTAVRHGLGAAVRHCNDTTVLRAVADTMLARGYSQLAASIAVRATIPSLHAVIAHDLWGDPIPVGLDVEYVALILAVYKAPGFAWNRHRHTVDPTERQALVDLVAQAGGRVDVAGLAGRLGARRAHLTQVFSRPQKVGDAPVWEPCLCRGGQWQQGRRAEGTERYLALVSCPHCGGHATVVARTPETPACLLCPTCRRMPTPGSPVFPDDYFLPARAGD